MFDQIHCRTFTDAVACLRKRGLKLGRISLNKANGCFVIEAERGGKVLQAFMLLVW